MPTPKRTKQPQQIQRPRGRPKKHLSQQQQAQVLEHIASGKPLKQYLAHKAGERVSYQSFYRTLKDDPTFRALHVQARQDQGDSISDEMLSIIHRVISGDLDPAQARAAMDGIKWLAARLNPRQWQERTKVEVEVSAKLTLIDSITQHLTKRAEPHLLDAEHTELDTDSPQG